MYKRQPKFFADEGKVVYDGRNILKRISLDNVDAVSYTHLDVYKRQGVLSVQIHFPCLFTIDIFRYIEVFHFACELGLDVYKRQLSFSLGFN